MILSAYIAAGVVADAFLVFLAIGINQSIPLGTAILVVCCVGILFLILTSGLVILVQFAFYDLIDQIATSLFLNFPENTHIIDKFVDWVTGFVCKKVFDTAEDHNDNHEGHETRVLESIIEVNQSIKAAEKSLKSCIADAIKSTTTK